MKTLFQWTKTNSVMLINAASLVGTTAVTSILGFVYWWMAARRFPPEAVGIASASISAMTLLGGFCILGLGTLLITELPRQPGQAGSLISTALLVVGICGGCVGLAFSLIAPVMSAAFRPLSVNMPTILIFASGVSLTAITLVLDQALVGLLRGSLQFWRNALFAVLKLVLLFALSFWLLGKSGTTIYATWAVGNALSLLALVALFLVKKGWPGRHYLPQWGLLRKLGAAALQHHLLNMILQAPTLMLPVLVTVLLSATMNAWFYLSWMVASFVFLLPNVLTIVLHAMNSAQQAMLARKARVTMSLGLLTSIAANCLFQLATQQILSVFGRAYAEQATWTLRILVLAAFPLIIKYHYISICRIQDRIAQAMLGMLPGGLLELGAATLGARVGGLTGLCIGWVAAVFIESLFMVPTVFRTVFSTTQTTSSVLTPQNAEYVSDRRQNTAPVPTLNWRGASALQAEYTPAPATGVPGVTEYGLEGVWLLDTLSQPVVSFSAVRQERVHRVHTGVEQVFAAQSAVHHPQKQRLRRIRFLQDDRNASENERGYRMEALQPAWSGESEHNKSTIMKEPVI